MTMLSVANIVVLAAAGIITTGAIGVLVWIFRSQGDAQ